MTNFTVFDALFEAKYPEQLFIIGHQLCFSKQFTGKSVQEELILYQKTYISS